MRPVELADRNLVRDQLPKTLPRKPCVQVKCRRFHFERRLAELPKVQVDRMVRRRAQCHRNPGKGGEHGPMNVPTPDQLRTRVTPDDSCQFFGIEEILPVHVPDPALERRVVQEKQRRSINCGRQRCVQPLQRRRLEQAMRLSGNARIKQQEIDAIDFDLLIEWARCVGIGR